MKVNSTRSITPAPGNGLFEPLAGDGVHARVWSGGNSLMPLLVEFLTTFDPIKPVPPITTSFMTSPLMMVSRQQRHTSHSPPGSRSRIIRKMQQPDLVALAGKCACTEAASPRGTAGPRGKLASPHIGSQLRRQHWRSAETRINNFRSTQPILRWIKSRHPNRLIATQHRDRLPEAARLHR